MSAAVLDALRNAVSALVTAAPEPIVKRMLRELLAEEASPRSELSTPRGKGALEPVAATASKPGAAVKASASANGARRTAVAKLASSSAASGWPELRPRVRSAMRARGLNYAGLAAATGYSRTTVSSALGSNAAPTRAMQAKLAVWLEAAGAPAAEAAAPALPFRAARGNGNGTVGRTPAPDAPASTA